jgi:hypothetical protein
MRRVRLMDLSPYCCPQDFPRDRRSVFRYNLPAMPWNRNEPDPLDARRRQLAEQERAVAEQRRRLTEEMQASGATTAKRAEPLVWRSEDENPAARAAEPTPARKRNLARQRQRDMILVIGLTLLFLIVLGLMLWVAYVHNIAPGASA